MEKSSSEDSSIHRSPSLDSKDSDFAKPSTSGKQFGRGFTAGAFYEFKKCNMARGCLCCLKYMMFLFNLIFWSLLPRN
nr:tetraspanin-9 [Dromaius novaehollandiae]